MVNAAFSSVPPSSAMTFTFLASLVSCLTTYLEKTGMKAQMAIDLQIVSNDFKMDVMRDMKEKVCALEG